MTNLTAVPSSPCTGGSRSLSLRRAPVQSRAKERIERVLDATEKVFVEVGYDKATTNMIASQAETSIGSIYQFFGDKEALATALAERYIAELAALPGDDPDDRGAIVVKLVDALDTCFTRHPGIGPLLRGCRGSDDRVAAGAALQASLVEQVERHVGLRRQDIDPMRRHMVAEVCANVLRGILDEAAGKPDGERAVLLAELKLILTSYLAVALPRPQSSLGGARTSQA